MTSEELQQDLREHILANTLLPDPDIQRDRQRIAAAKHEAEQAERQAHLDSLVVAPSVPNSDNPLQARPARLTKYLPDLTKRSARDRAAIARAKIKLAAKRSNK